VIRDALATIARHTGCRLDYETWNPLDDDRARMLIRQGDTMGCFYIESPATRLLLKKLWRGMPPARGAQADDFEYLTIVSSLVRPAAHVFVNEFLRRAHGHPYEPLHPLLTGVLDETFGILVYQEDVMKVAMVLGGFTVEEGDQLRKVLAKKHRERRLRDFQRLFYDGAKARGVPAATIEQIWAMIMSFAGYSFCKPHSASYAQVSFKCAFLRAHYPAEFMAAVISNLGGFYSTYAYLSEARRMGLSILPPDINASDWACTGTGGWIRMGLMQLKGLQRPWVEKIVRARQDSGPFQSLREFLERVPPEPDQTCRLIKAGCFDSVAGELTRPALLWQLLAWQKGTRHNYLPIPREYSHEQLLAHEIESFGFPLRAHPLDLSGLAGDRIPRVLASEMGRHVGRRIVMGGVLLTEKVVHTKHGDPMEFVTFEDQTALYDATVFPALYRQSCHLLAPDHTYLVKGTVQQQFRTVTLTLQQIRCLDGKPKAVAG
jgi:error-prone DNA polymerase